MRLAEKGTEPDWADLKARVEFLRKVRGLRIELLRAFRDGDAWGVPFFAANDELLGERDPRQVIERNTPYKVSAYRKVEPSRADAETLRIMVALVEGEPRSAWMDDVAPSFEPLRPRAPEEVFDGLVGMEGQKARLMRLARVVERCGRDALESFHLVFVGPPGTGKTELASRLISYLDLLGVTDGTHRLVRAGEADLVAKYVGHTAPKVRSVVESALGGLLFIDEFYAIANAPHYGREALDCLVEQLDLHRHDFVCVAAGYPEEVDRTLDLNPGLRERFGYRVEFPGYSVVELEEIFGLFVQRKGFELRCSSELRPCLEELASARGFSNARSVRRLADHCACEACWNHEGRYIDERDLRAATAQCVAGREVRRVGF